MMKMQDISVCICVGCDRDETRMETAVAEGRTFFKRVRKQVKDLGLPVTVQGVNCMGGCACRTVEETNASCSVGLTGAGKFGYVLNRFLPDDEMKVVSVLKSYMARKDGMLTPKKGGIDPALTQHIATRLPPRG